MPPDSEWQVIFPEIDQPVRFFFPVLINVQIDLGSLRVYVTGNLAGGIKSFGIGQVIHQLNEITGHFIGIG